MYLLCLRRSCLPPDVIFGFKKRNSCCFAAGEESCRSILILGFQHSFFKSCSCACVRALKPLNKDYLSKIFYYCSYIYIGKSSKLNCLLLILLISSSQKKCMALMPTTPLLYGNIYHRCIYYIKIPK